ncbi:vitamin K epoxide reductase family protein [Rothia sp. ND6WE1A]|uniref:vitamin K epoxide reductase family protein n=1 Tax=Rothia sp. ND6WE1A TaxID=1848190 RepID=UPI000AA33368|nr:vitamin K epoxide reductase family protein [Rothia sp. ND6WE1A]
MPHISEASTIHEYSTHEAMKADTRYAILSLLTGILAFASSAMLVYEHLQIAKDASHVSVCDMNAILNCGTVMRTPFAEAFGFPNPYIGLVGYAITITIATAILAGARFSRWYWLCMNVGHVLAFCFILYLWFNTTFVIGALCLFCMIVWIMQTILMTKTTAYNIQTGVIPAPEHIRHAVAGWSWFVVILIFVLLFGIIIIHFFDQIINSF